MSKKEKFVLDFDELEGDFFEDASIIGIVCKEEAYHFIWQCNKILNINFKLYKGIPNSNLLSHYNVYEYVDRKNFLQHYIYQIKTSSGNLLPELKNFDYLWLIKGSEDRLYHIEKILEAMSTLNKVQIATKLKEGNLKNKTCLII